MLQLLAGLTFPHGIKQVAGDPVPQLPVLSNGLPFAVSLELGLCADLLLDEQRQDQCLMDQLPLLAKEVAHHATSLCRGSRSPR